MKDKDIFSFSQRRSDKIKSMASEASVKVSTAEITIDQTLPFQRLYVVASPSDVDIEEVMKYELQTFPPSLFETATVLRKPNKPQLAKALQEHALNTTSMIPESSSDKNKNHQFILDGGSLIHKIKWQKGEHMTRLLRHMHHLF